MHPEWLLVGDFNMITRAEDKNRPAWEDQYAKE
jgi:hypothetical protein